MKSIKLYLVSLAALAVVSSAISCKGKTSTAQSGDGTATDTLAQAKPVGPAFSEDSAYAFTAKQCSFGPRTMNSAAHDECAAWIVRKFAEYGCKVIEQKADLKGYDGTVLKSNNIIAQVNSQAKKRILICAHWDSRPWADNDPDSANHRKPVIAANDGASGVGVMLELARVLHKAKDLKIGVDFVCFDAEDWGVPQWETRYQDATGDSWALGAQYYAANFPTSTKPIFGVLLDMVGGEGAQFYREGMSVQYASDIVDRVWSASKAAGFGSYFPDTMGGMVTDDHVPVNQVAGIPTIDVIPYYPDCQQSSFGPTWHTVNDTMEHIDKNTLKAVGQTMIQVLYTTE